MLIISVPHSKCDVPCRTRCCDERALELALALKSEVKDAVVHRSTWDRALLDLNRATARGSEWRKQLSEMMRDPKARVLVDAHSFPSMVGSFGLRYDPPIVLLWLGKKSKKFADRVVYAWPGAVALPGSSKNDILLEAMEEHRLPALLVEACEDKNVLTETRLQDFAEMLGNVISEYF